MNRSFSVILLTWFESLSEDMVDEQDWMHRFKVWKLNGSDSETWCHSKRPAMILGMKVVSLLHIEVSVWALWWKGSFTYTYTEQQEHWKKLSTSKELVRLKLVQVLNFLDGFLELFWAHLMYPYIYTTAVLKVYFYAGLMQYHSVNWSTCKRIESA